LRIFETIAAVEIHWLNGNSSTRFQGYESFYCDIFSRLEIYCCLGEHLLDLAIELLPHQGILENFVHHNPLSHLETMKWKEALEYAVKLESYMSPVRGQL
jgi:hypothetical protein